MGVTPSVKQGTGTVRRTRRAKYGGLSRRLRRYAGGLEQSIAPSRRLAPKDFGVHYLRQLPDADSDQGGSMGARQHRPVCRYRAASSGTPELWAAGLLGPMGQPPPGGRSTQIDTARQPGPFMVSGFRFGCHASTIASDDPPAGCERCKSARPTPPAFVESSGSDRCGQPPQPSTDMEAKPRRRLGHDWLAPDPAPCSASTPGPHLAGFVLPATWHRSCS